jgi:hypothetical protein
VLIKCFHFTWKCYFISKAIRQFWLTIHTLGLAVSSVTTASFLQERDETGVQVYQEDVLQGVVKYLNMTFTGQEWVSQQELPKRPRQLRSGCGGTFWPSSVPRIGFGECRPQNPGQWTVGCFGGHGMLKASQKPEEPEQIPCEDNGRDPPGDRACGDSRVAGGSRGLRRGIGRPFWVTLS